MSAFGREMPGVVFVTAYDRHALWAFEVHALDYVLKPVDPERLREALERARSFLSLKQGVSLADRLAGLLRPHVANVPRVGGASSLDRIVVKAGDKISFLEIDQVAWFESEGNYVRVHSAGKAHVIRSTMDRIEARLAARRDFIRVRRSAIVNVKAIASLERYGKGTYVIQLRSGAKVISSRHYQARLRDMLESGS